LPLRAATAAAAAKAPQVQGRTTEAGEGEEEEAGRQGERKRLEVKTEEGGRGVGATEGEV